MRRILTYQAALLGGTVIFLSAYGILAIDAAHHQFLPFDRDVREWVQPMRSGGLDLSFYLDRHWLSDVIGGFALGTAYLLIALWASRLIFASRPAAGLTNPAEAIPAA